jgi:hypothetical protein
MDKEFRLHTLTDYKKQRVREVIDYQINIDNFRHAIEIIGDEPEMQEFKSQLDELLKSHLYEQRKAQIMLDAITMQLEEISNG